MWQEGKELRKTCKISCMGEDDRKAHENKCDFNSFLKYFPSTLFHFGNDFGSFADSTILKDSKFNKFHRYGTLNKEDTPVRYLHARRKIW